MGIDLPRDIGTRRLPWSRLRRLIEHSPDDSALIRARRGAGTPTVELAILRRIEYWTHVGAWLQTKDAEKGKNRPEMIPFAGDRKRSRHRDGIALDEALTARQAKRAAELARMKEEG